ncbi:MAG: hypothetical protein ACK5MN_06605 [Lachnospiraceae bacterium]
MNTAWIVLLIIAIVLVIAVVVLYFVSKRAQKKQEAQQEQMEAAKQTMSMLIIDKKKLPIKDSGLPQIVIDQTPRLLRRSKMPIVKAKVGPKIITLACDAKVFDLLPLKKEIKADVSGIYIVSARGVRGPLEAPPQKKKGFIRRFLTK